MAGSLFNYQYTTDAGTTFMILTDKSNATAKTAGGIQLSLAYTVAGLTRLTNNFRRMRYAYAVNSANTAEKRRFLVGNPLAYAELAKGNATIKVEDYPGAADTPGVVQTWNITGVKPERLRLAPPVSATDTGLTV